MSDSYETLLRSVFYGWYRRLGKPYFYNWVVGMLIDAGPDAREGWFAATPAMKQSAARLCDYFSLIDTLVGDVDVKDEVIDALLGGTRHDEADLIRIFL